MTLLKFTNAYTGKPVWVRPDRVVYVIPATSNLEGQPTQEIAYLHFTHGMSVCALGNAEEVVERLGIYIRKPRRIDDPRR